MTVNTARIRSFYLAGPAGRLEAVLNAGSETPSHSALVCHPHPLYGGTFHNKVVFHAMKALNSFGFPVLRFNFRGTGRSEGVHDEGRGERDDVRAALDFLHSEFGLPILFAGFSFGAAVGMRVCCGDPRVPAIISLGTPVFADGRHYEYNFLETCNKPKLLISGSLDEFATPEALAEIYSRAAEPKQLSLVEGGDHFFADRLDAMRHELAAWVGRLVGRHTI